ncbi:MAG: hypothetical protein RL748_3940 [Pseudomonadota bacterium]
MSTNTPPSVPPLGPLAAFTGTWSGPGFNTIFRPNSSVTPTQFPNNPTEGPTDNVLQLNITQETLTFSAALGSVPNRAFLPGQADIFLNGVPYAQSVFDVTDPAVPPSSIHFEPGLWVIVPPTVNPPESQGTVVRMGSIPHGTTIEAQGTFATFPGGPQIDPVNITPFPIGQPNQPIPFPSQQANLNNTLRIPQVLPPTITQDMLNNPNSVLTEAIAGQNIISTTVLNISTVAAPPLAGGGTDNILFLQGSGGSAPSGPNANAVQMTAVFWIETVQRKDGSTFTQIQYTQTVFLNFNGLTWPHVSVATLTQTAP